MSSTKDVILQKYALSTNDLIHKGMEAEVYAMGTDAVLKLYSGTTELVYLTALQFFYDSLSWSTLSYCLPDIQMVAAEDGICLTVERRLPGTPMSAILQQLTREQMDSLMQAYLTSALELTSVHIPPEFDRYKLFDAEGLSRRTQGDWHYFLARFLDHKLIQVASYLEKDVTDFVAKVQQLYGILSQPYTGDYRLIHGDFFPGNLLIDETHRVTALLDFGLFTMYGDYLFDIATGWIFFDMYDQLKASIRERYLAMTLERLGEGVRGKLYRYVLLYSILSANTYSPDCADGHYQWCVTNLNNQNYWQDIE